MINFLSKFFASHKDVIVDRFEKSVLDMSRLDGKEGMSMEDIKLVYAKIQSINVTMKGSDWRERAQAVATWVDRQFGDRIPDDLSDTIVKYLFDAATLLGKLRK